MLDINLFNFNVSVPYLVIYLVVGSLITLFLVWYHAVKDGFDKEKIFDMFFLTFITWGVLSFGFMYAYTYYYYLEQYKEFFALVSFFVISITYIYLFTKKLKWSIYRILDIFSLVYFGLLMSLFISNIFINKQLVGISVVAAFSILYLLFYFYRNKTFSGLTFSVFLICFVFVGNTFYNSDYYLIFYVLLITISMINLFFRQKKAMFKTNLSSRFINKIKGLLFSKRHRLKEEQKKLIEEDPYLQEGRDVGNSEETDEAILEDRAKIESDIKKRNIEGMQDQVEKALKRLDEGLYGVCEICGEPIDKARLEAYPEATVCINHTD